MESNAARQIPRASYEGNLRNKSDKRAVGALGKRSAATPGSPNWKTHATLHIAAKGRK